MADRRVKVIFSAEIQNFKRAMEEAAHATQKTKKSSEESSQATDTYLGKLVKSATQNSEAWERTGAVVAGAGAVMVAGVGLAVKSFADFDKQMSSVQAATHESADNMDALRDAAVKAGADTAFSATEAAQGIEELAKAGVSTSDILSGGLKGSLDLAAAGNLGVGESAEIAASALTQFKLSGDKIPHLADLLAAGAGKAQGSVRDLGMALNQSGLVAASTGLTIEETTGALAAFASAGLTGSDAGTSFKTMLMSLNPNSAAAATLMEQLGISAYDAQGNFIGMSEYAGVLRNALKGMSDEQRNATLKTVFGSDAVRAANVLYQQGAEGIQKWEDAVNDAGYAAETAAIMQDNLAGDIERLGGSIDSVFLKSGSGANDFLRGLAQGAEDVVDAIGQIPAPALSAGAAFTGIVGVAALGAGAFLTLTPRILETKIALDTLAPAGSKANAVLSRTGKIAAGAATGIAALGAASIAVQPAMDNLYQPTGETADALKRFSGEAAQGALSAETLGKSFEDLIIKQDGMSSFQSAINNIADPGLWGNIDNIATQGIGLLSLGMIKAESTSERARERFRAMGEQLASLEPKKASEAFQSMVKHTDGSSESLKRLLEYMPAYRKQLEEQAKGAQLATDDQTLLDIAMGKVKVSAEGASGAIKGTGEAASAAAPLTEEQVKALEDVGLAADGTVESLSKLLDAMFATGLATMSARDAEAAYQEQLDTLKGRIDEVKAAQTDGNRVWDEAKGSFDLTSDAGQAANAVFGDLQQSAINTTKAMANAGATQPELQAKLGDTYRSLYDTARAFGASEGKADDLARAALGIPKNVPIETAIQNYADTLAKAQGVKGAIDAIPTSKTINIYTVEHISQVRASGDVHTANSMETANRYASGAAYATGGRLPGFTDGGKLPSTGPGTEITDGFLGVDALGMPRVRVDAEEWIINPFSSNRYNRELAAINAGTFPKLPGYAMGGRPGREYSAQSLGHTAYRSQPAPSAGVQIGKVEINDQSDPVSTWHELNRRVARLGV